MERIKENAAKDFIEFIGHAWTWKRLTEEEQKQFLSAIDSVQGTKAISGTYDARWNVCYACYTSFLYALGYGKADNDGWFDWRPKKEEVESNEA